MSNSNQTKFKVIDFCDRKTSVMYENLGHGLKSYQPTEN